MTEEEYEIESAKVGQSIGLIRGLANLTAKRASDAKNTSGLENVSCRINENGRLQLIPENNEETSVTDVASAVKEGVDYMIASNFSGVLNVSRR